MFGGEEPKPVVDMHMSCVLQPQEAMSDVSKQPGGAFPPTVGNAPPRWQAR